MADPVQGTVGEPPQLLEHVLCVDGVLGPDAASDLLEVLDRTYVSQEIRFSVWSSAEGEVRVLWDPSTSSAEVSSDRPPVDILSYNESTRMWVSTLYVP